MRAIIKRPAKKRGRVTILLAGWLSVRLLKRAIIKKHAKKNDGAKGYYGSVQFLCDVMHLVTAGQGTRYSTHTTSVEVTFVA